MADVPYTLMITLDEEPAAAEARVREALADEGFGILSEIDVQAALRSKLGEDIGAYKILGACNPPLASRAIAADPDVGALLPCNVVVRANPSGGSMISAADPLAMLSVAHDVPDEVATEARERLLRALETLSAR